MSSLEDTIREFIKWFDSYPAMLMDGEKLVDYRTTEHDDELADNEILILDMTDLPHWDMAQQIAPHMVKSITLGVSQSSVTIIDGNTYWFQPLQKVKGKTVLKCSNPKCESNQPGSEYSDGVFSTSMVINKYGELNVPPTHIPGDEYTCCFCSSEGEEWQEE